MAKREEGRYLTMGVKNKPLILVVEDEENIRLMLQRILDKAGYNVVVACNGREALDHLARTAISLILLDVRMPELDGLTTLKLIRNRYSTPVIIVTADVGALGEALKIGANDYIVKPFPASELLLAVKVRLKG